MLDYRAKCLSESREYLVILAMLLAKDGLQTNKKTVVYQVDSFARRF